MIPLRRLLLLGLCGSALVAAEPSRLEIFSGNHPVSFFFREADGPAAQGKIPYETWAARYGRLSGIMGKMLDEEVLGRSAAQPYFRRFKAEHPEQAVFVHTNPNFRNPQADNRFLHAGHWLYYNGATVSDAVNAADDTTVLHVSDASLFQLSPYAVNAAIPDDVGLCAVDAAGRPDWNRAEQTKLLAVDRAAGTITLQRGLYGSKKQAFAAGTAYVASHVAQTWGTVNKLWQLNLSTAGPRDASGRTAGEVWADEIVRFLRPGGELEFVDGVEFDVPFRKPMALGGARRADCDADGKPDDGIVGGVPVFAVGVDNFFRRLRAGLPERLILADVGDRAQRSLESVNGVETEGWPRLRDPEFHAWSTALNDHAFWEERARPPVFTYGLVKFRGQDEVPFASARLAMAGPLLTGSAVPSTYTLPAGSTGILDELVGGKLNRRGWLGKSAGPAKHLALEGPALTLAPGGAPPADAVVGRQEARVEAHARPAGAEKFAFRVARFAHAAAGDVVVRMTVRAAARPGYPQDSYRLLAVGAVPADAEWSAGADTPTTPAGDRPFTAVFYLRDVPAGNVDLWLGAEGAENVGVEDVSVHEGADAMVAGFEHGAVLANPSGRPFVFRLGEIFPGAKWRRLQATAAQDARTNDGQKVNESVEVPAHDALFLLKE